MMIFAWIYIALLILEVIRVISGGSPEATDFFSFQNTMIAFGIISICDRLDKLIKKGDKNRHD